MSEDRDREYVEVDVLGSVGSCIGWIVGLFLALWVASWLVYHFLHLFS